MALHELLFCAPAKKKHAYDCVAEGWSKSTAGEEWWDISTLANAIQTDAIVLEASTDLHYWTIAGQAVLSIVPPGHGVMHSFPQ